MEDWHVNFDESAERDFVKLDKSLKIRVGEKLDWLSKNFEKITPVGLSDNWSGYFKLRIGDYRIVYKIMLVDREIKVVAIEHRSKIYKRK